MELSKKNQKIISILAIPIFIIVFFIMMIYTISSNNSNKQEEKETIDAKKYNVEKSIEKNTTNANLSEEINEESTIIETTIAESNENNNVDTPKTYTYILNTNTKKIHTTLCSSGKKIKNTNKKEVTCTYNELIQQGYSPCTQCRP